MMKEVTEADMMDNRRQSQGGGNANPEFMNRMFAKMSEKLEDKFKAKPELAFMKQKYAQAQG